MKNSNFSGGGSGTGISATGDASSAKKVANVSVKNSPSTKSQSAYYSEAGECDSVDQSKAGVAGKGYYGDRDGR